MCWLTIYSRIVLRHFSNYWYIDLLASFGANVIEETEDVILGSPLLSYLIPYELFKRHIFVELDPQKRRILDWIKCLDISNFQIMIYSKETAMRKFMISKRMLTNLAFPVSFNDLPNEC